VTAQGRVDFGAVDEGDTADLVAMMAATDAWPAVGDGRNWVLQQADLAPGGLVVDAGCGLGTFGAAASAAGGAAIDVDNSLVMLAEARRRYAGARPVLADLAHLALRTASARLVRAERVLQWTDDPRAVLAELWRVTAPDGWTVVTDTDWGTLAVDHPQPAAMDRLAAAALRWVRHPRVARSLPRLLRALGAAEVRVRADTVVLTAWDPDDPRQRAGPPGLPLRSIAAAATAADRAGLARDLATHEAVAREGNFYASLVLVTVAARRRTDPASGARIRGER
jgi:SAM-dependent methyltransferase